MRKKENFVFTFVLFFLLSILIFFLAKNNSLKVFDGVLERVLMPFQSLSHNIAGFPNSIFSNKETEKLKEENLLLLKRLVDQRELEKENSALKDQFGTTTVSSKNLMPADVVGSPGFIPQISGIEYFVLNKGEKDGVKNGQAVIYKNFVVGKVAKVMPYLSVVDVITNKATSFTAKTMQTSALGVLKGQGRGEMIFDNVLLSDELKLNDEVLTKGDIDSGRAGFIPNLVVGKIKSIDKKPSALFQKAVVQSPLDFPKISTVFIIVSQK